MRYVRDVRADVREITSVESIIQGKTNRINDLYNDIRVLEDLATCFHTTEAFSELLAKIQAGISINCLNLEGYANLEHWVAELDTRIEGISHQRLTHLIEVWCAKFDRTNDVDIRRDAPVRDIIRKQRGDKWVKEDIDPISSV